MASLTELVEKHGLPVKVCCDISGYPPFTILEQTGDTDGVAIYKIKYESGKISNYVIGRCPSCDDYHHVKE